LGGLFGVGVFFPIRRLRRLTQIIFWVGCLASGGVFSYPQMSQINADYFLGGPFGVGGVFLRRLIRPIRPIQQAVPPPQARQYPIRKIVGAL
jgi:hypothetical protein